MNWPVVTDLYTGTAGPLFENDLSGFCAAHRVSAILVGPGTPATLVAAISALHWQETNAHGVRVVRVPDPRSLHFHQVLGDYWPQDSWMGRQVNIVTHGQPIELRITGQYRPVELGPVEIRATVNGSETASYRIGQPGHAGVEGASGCLSHPDGKRYLHTEGAPSQRRAAESLGGFRPAAGSRIRTGAASFLGMN